jgi:Kelch motif
MRVPRFRTLGPLLVAGIVLVGAPAVAAKPAAPQASVSWVFGPTLPFEATRWDGAYVAFQKRVYFLGFRTTGDATDGSVWYYDVGSNSYVDTGVDMPVPISNYQIAALQDSTGLGLYIFGGRDANAQIVDTVQVYYPATNTASTVSTDPYPGQTLLGCVSLPAMGVATVNNRAVVMGGVSFTANGCLDDNSQETWIYAPNAPAGSRWSQGPDLNLARGYITPAVLGGKVYAIGGDINVAGTLIPQVTVESLDSPTGSWDDGAVADLPTSCDESQAFAPPSGPLAGHIVLAGCGQWPNALPDVYDYDSSTGAWSFAGSLNETRRNQAGTFVKLEHSTKMFVLGGYAADGVTPLTSTEIGIGSAIARPGFARPIPNASAGSPTTS